MILRRWVRPHSRGQSLVEFALIVPVFIALIGAIVQFGMVFWAQNTLTQVARDTGRWAATQTTLPCSNGLATLGDQANLIASNSSLFGYQDGEFASPTNAGSDVGVAGFTTVNAMAVAWVHDSAETPTQPCPPTSNAAVWHVTVKMNQRVPTFFPGMQYLPALGTCDSSGCSVTLSSTTQFRMEPAP